VKGFVWRDPEDFGAAEIPSGYRGTYTMPAWGDGMPVSRP